jgi:hypothetical protein
LFAQRLMTLTLLSTLPHNSLGESDDPPQIPFVTCITVTDLSETDALVHASSAK